VSFQYRSDSKETPQFGLIAEEVAKVNPDLVVRNRNGDIYSVRYDQVNAMLLNEFLKEHTKVQELGATVAKQEAVIAKQQKDFQAIATHQQKQIEALTAGLQKVSAQLATANGAAGMRRDIDGSSRQADMSGSELVNPSLADLKPGD